jgi:hypothetical protein
VENYLNLNIHQQQQVIGLYLMFQSTYDDVTDATELPSTLGYIRIENEIMQYTAGGAGTSGTFTGLKRGLFGTTVAAHAQNLDMYILNTLIITNSAAGLCRGIADVIEE